MGEIDNVLIADWGKGTESELYNDHVSEGMNEERVGACKCMLYREFLHEVPYTSGLTGFMRHQVSGNSVLL